MTIDLEQGWDFIQKGITKLQNIIEGQSEPRFSSEEYMEIYTTIYTMCTQKPPHDCSKQLYEKYRESYEEYIKSTVLSSLREKQDDSMLRELMQRWSNHKIMVHSMSRFFDYLDRYFAPMRSLPSLREVGITCFRDLVYMEFSGKARAAVLSLVRLTHFSNFAVLVSEFYFFNQINKEREGKQIDRSLLNNLLDIFYLFEEKKMTRMDYLYVESELKTMDDYETDFEEAMLKDTAAYYSQKASDWILEDSCPIYMLKAEECLKQEKDMVSNYLCSSMETKLLEKGQHELLSVYATQLLEGCHALLRDDKVEDLSRMYRRFSKIPQGLEPIAAIFKQHVTAEGTAIVKQAEDAASNNSQQNFGCITSIDSEGWVIINFSREQVFVRKIIELHDKYMAYVNDCFSNDSLLHEALEEAFEVFCNKGVAGSSSAEVVATFCDNILKKDGSEKLSDEAIGETF